jgi:tRNA dimethylallyltransferase
MKALPQICILGPTASGKTKLAVSLAKELNGAVLSVDSRQVYKHLDIGTGKDLAEYTIEGQAIPHYLLDIVELGQEFNLRMFFDESKKASKAVLDSKKQAIWCGGSGLYFETLVKPKPFLFIPPDYTFRKTIENLTTEELKARWENIPGLIKKETDNSTRKRIVRALEIAEFEKNQAIPKVDSCLKQPLIFIIDVPAAVRRERIEKRLEIRLQEGMIEEVEVLLEMGVSKDWLIRLGLEYKWIVSYLNKELTLSEMKKGLLTAIHQFAKRQATWFRGMEKRGFEVNWLTLNESNDINLSEVLEKIKPHL